MTETLNQPQAAERKPVALAIAIFLLLWLPAAILSHGYPEADGYTHFLAARYALAVPTNFTDVWARPVCTILYCLPSIIGGHFGICVASAAIAIGCGVVAFQIARDQGDRPALALILTLAQPLLFVHSLTVMTELPFALLLGCTFLAFERKRWFIAALLAGLLPAARPEGFGFLIFAGCALLWLAPRWLLILPLPLVIWNLTGWLQDGREGQWWMWMSHHWPYSAQSMYGRGSIMAFAVQLPVIVSPLVLPATLLGIALSFRPLRVARAATALIPLFVLTVHSLLYATGKMGSYGEARYLLVAAPFWGILSARGWEWCFGKLRWSHSLRWAGAAAMVPLLVNCIHPFVPLRPTPDCELAERLGKWYPTSAQGQRYTHLLASHIAVYYFSGISPTDQSRAVRFNKEMIAARPPDTLLIWDPYFSMHNANMDCTVSLDEIARAGWVADPAIEDQLGLGSLQWHVFHSP